MLLLSSRKGHHKAAALIILTKSLSTTAAALNVCIITGTTRTEGPPWPILGPRVADFCIRSLEKRGNTVKVIDPKLLEISQMKPHFAYPKSKVPPVLQTMHELLEKADAYVTITPEYNHAPAPGLLNVLNHFGSSTFGFKPSAIVTYSAGQWGGSRAAHSLRPILSELGCLPVSAMIHIPNAGNILEEDGSVIQDEERWESYTDRCFSQLEWWGEATRVHRNVCDPLATSPAFKTDPSQRNVPK